MPVPSSPKSGTAGSRGVPPFGVTGQSRFGTAAETNNHNDRPSHVLSFLLSAGGAAFIFPNTSVYPETTQRITTRPGTKSPLRDLFLERHPRMPREIRDLSHVSQRERILGLEGSPELSHSASVDREPRFEQPISKITLKVPERRIQSRPAP